MRAIPLCLLGGLLALPVQAFGVQDLLGRLAAAERQQSFQGTFIYERNGSFSTHAVWHRVEEGGQIRERLLQLDGPAQEVLKVDGQTQCVTGALADQVSEGQAWPARQLDAEQLSNWYNMRVAGQSRIANRAADVLVLEPRGPASLRLRIAPGSGDRSAVEIPPIERARPASGALSVRPVGHFYPC